MLFEGTQHAPSFEVEFHGKTEVLFLAEPWQGPMRLTFQNVRQTQRWVLAPYLLRSQDLRASPKREQGRTSVSPGAPPHLGSQWSRITL